MNGFSVLTSLLLQAGHELTWGGGEINLLLEAFFPPLFKPSITTYQLGKTESITDLRPLSQHKHHDSQLKKTSHLSKGKRNLICQDSPNQQLLSPHSLQVKKPHLHLLTVLGYTN